MIDVLIAVALAGLGIFGVVAFMISLSRLAQFAEDKGIPGVYVVVGIFSWVIVSTAIFWLRVSP